MKRLNFRPSQFVVMFGLLGGCGNQSDFGTNHFPELQLDCQQTLACSASQLEFVSANVTQECVEEAGDRLDEASEGAQNRFLDTVNRCQQLVQCDYVACTSSDPTSGYAAMHQPQIVNECQQTIMCRVQSGTSQPNNAVEMCVSQTSNMLNFATPQVQTAFEMRAVRCATQVGCMYSACP